MIDVETTGLYRSDRVVEVAVVTLDRSGVVVDEFETLINPGRDVGPTWIHRITASMVADAPSFEDIAGHVASRIDGAVVAAHNLPFDQRMLDAEFERAGITTAWGAGLDTLKAAGGKLATACREHGIDHQNAHSALADARATAQLLNCVLERFPASCHPAEARPFTVRNQRIVTRIGFAAVDPPAPYLAALAQGIHFAPDTADYLDLLDQALADLTITPAEREELAELATDLGLDETARRRAHREYFSGLVQAATEDHVVTPEELDQLLRAAALLDADQKQVTDRVDSYRTTFTEVPLEPGLTVCFTGEPIDGRGRPISREEMHDRALAAGLMPTGSVTKKGCQLLIAADPESRSGKVKKARQFAIPVASARDFLTMAGGGSPLPASVVEIAGIGLVCSGCGCTWVAKRRSSNPRCSDCR